MGSGSRASLTSSDTRRRYAEPMVMMTVASVHWRRRVEHEASQHNDERRLTGFA